ncbi:MAG: ABC transporter permease [Acidimicrobiales bacterium]
MSATSAALARRGAPPAAFVKILLNEARLAWRNPRGLAVGLGLPVLLLVVFGHLPKFNTPKAGLGGETLFHLYVPILISFVIGMVALYSLPGALASYREQGILRRLSTTPAPRSWLLAAQIVVNLVLVVAGLLILVVVGALAFNLGSPKDPAAFVLSAALSIAALFAIALLIAAVMPSGQAAQILGSLSFFPLIFFAGLWIPRPDMPALLQHISNYTPLGASVQALQDAMQGTFPPAAPLLVLAGYAVAFALLAWRFFRWE